MNFKIGGAMGCSPQTPKTIGTQHIGFSLGTALNHLDTQMPGGILGVLIRLIGTVWRSKII